MAYNLDSKCITKAVNDDPLFEKVVTVAVAALTALVFTSGTGLVILDTFAIVFFAI